MLIYIYIYIYRHCWIIGNHCSTLLKAGGSKSVYMFIYKFDPPALPGCISGGTVIANYPAMPVYIYIYSGCELDSKTCSQFSRTKNATVVPRSCIIHSMCLHNVNQWNSQRYLSRGLCDHRFMHGGYELHHSLFKHQIYMWIGHWWICLHDHITYCWLKVTFHGNDF